MMAACQSAMLESVEKLTPKGIKRCCAQCPTSTKRRCTDSNVSEAETTCTRSSTSPDLSWVSSTSHTLSETGRNGVRDEACSAHVLDDVNFAVPSKWRFLQQVGRGAFSTVAAFQDTSGHRCVAVKRIGAEVLKQPGVALGIAHELQVLRNCGGHDNVVKMLDAYSIAGHPEIYIVMELISQTLQDIIYSWTDHTEQFCKFYMFKILTGLQFLHAKCVSHCDLKPRNVLVDGQTVKICDFNSSREHTFCPRATNDFYDLTDCLGSRFWRAPEILLLTTCNSSVDIWSVGCIFAEMLNCRILFRGRSEFDQVRVIMKTVAMPRVEDLELSLLQPGAESFLMDHKQEHGPDFAELLMSQRSSHTVAVLKGMLQFDRRNRASAAECLKHQYFSTLSSIQQDVEAVSSGLTCVWHCQEASSAEELRQNLPCYSVHPSGHDIFL